MTIMRRSAVHIKISVLCILNLHSILIAERSSQSQLVPSVQHTDRGPSLCAIKPELPEAGAECQRDGTDGRRGYEARGTGKSKFTSAVKRQRRSVFNIFQRVLPFHVVSSSSSASAAGADAAPSSQLAVSGSGSWSCWEERTQEEDTDTFGARSGQSCSWGFCAGMAKAAGE